MGRMNKKKKVYIKFRDMFKIHDIARRSLTRKI